MAESINWEMYAALILEVNAVPKRITIKDKVFNDVVNIAGAVNNIYFDSVEFMQPFTYMSPGKEDLTLQFANCVFNGIVNITNSNLNFLELRYCQGNSCVFRTLKMSDELLMYFCQFKNFNAHKITTASTKIEFNKNSRIVFSDFYCTSRSVVENNENCQIFFNDPSDTVGIFPIIINFLTVSVHSAFAGGLHITEAVINSLVLTGELDKALIDITSTTCKDVSISKLNNGGTLKFSNIKVEPGANLKIEESDLGKIVLFGIDFTSFEDIYIRATNLNDIIYSGVNWCNRIVSTRENPMSFLQLREIYRQLKNSSAKQNNKPEEIRFHSLEMNSYSKELTNAKMRWNDKLILKFNGITNDHGQSWLRPLVLLFIIVIPVYFVIKCLLGFTTFAPKNIAISISEILECFNPVRKFTDSFGLTALPRNDNYTAIAKILDIVFLRLCVALLIFQLIKAFRKYVL